MIKADDVYVKDVISWILRWFGANSMEIDGSSDLGWESSSQGNQYNK
jgi:hypothetical protein